MKILKFISSFLCIILFTILMGSCKNHKDITSASDDNPKSTAENNMVQLSDTSNYSLLVSFFSIGSGIDFEVAKEYDQFIKKFESENQGKLLVERIPWGREGELDYCIRFEGLSPVNQKALLDKTKEITSKSKWVNTSTDTTCKRKRK